MVGQTVSHYRVLRRLGGGGMGEVYEALDLALGRHVAIKFLTSAHAHNRESFLRFEREARAASALNHPHICTIHEFGLSDTQPFIVMELLDGKTLRDRLKAAPLATPDIVDIGCQVADALDAAHTPPASSTATSRPRTCSSRTLATRRSWTSASRSSRRRKTRFSPSTTDETEETHENLKTSPGAALGTTAYMSPEQARAEPARPPHGPLLVRLRALRDGHRAAGVRRPVDGDDLRRDPPRHARRAAIGEPRGAVATSTASS